MTKPSLRERFRPAELIGLSAAFALFLGLVVAMITKDWVMAGIGFGIVFIVSLVVLAMLALTASAHDDDPKDGSRGPVL